MPGDSCDDGLPCTENDTCLANAVCLGTRNPALPCGANCTVDCSQTCAPCCSLSDNYPCDIGCGVCTQACQGCETTCFDGSVCSVYTGGGGSDVTLSCLGASCVGDLSAGSFSRTDCGSGAVCEVTLRDGMGLYADCDASTCAFALRTSSTIIEDVVTCTNGANCVVDVQTKARVDCTDSTCTVTTSGGGDTSVRCLAGGACRLSCSDVACDLSCSSGAAGCAINCQGSGGAFATCAAGSTCTCP